MIPVFGGVTTLMRTLEEPAMTPMPITRVVLYKHGVGYFERQGPVEGDATLSLTVKQSEVSDVLKSLTVLDLDGGHVASVSYDSTKPLEQLLAEVSISIPDTNSLVGLLPQLKGARVALTEGGQRTEGVLLGVDSTQKRSADGIVNVTLVSLLNDGGSVRSFELHGLGALEILDPALRRDLEFYLRTELSAKKKDARTFSFFANGQGNRRVRLSYVLEAPVWKATYRILLGEEGKPPLIQGWAVVDNTQDEDWESVTLSLVAGLPVSFVHDLYTPRYIRRPVVEVRETTGVLPPEVEGGVEVAQSMLAEFTDMAVDATESPPPAAAASPMAFGLSAARKLKGIKTEAGAAPSSMPAQVRERKLGDLFEYEIEHPVTIRRNQSALVPIVLRPFEGKPALLHNSRTRRSNPMRAVEFKNTTGLTLEGGPVTVLEGGSYVGEAMLETLKPYEKRLIPYAVELSVFVLDNVDTYTEKVHKTVIRDGRLVRHSSQVRQTTYHLDNRSDVEQTAYLDHPRDQPRYGDAWSLTDSPEPVETTENFWRFKFTLPAKKVTRFVVKQRQELQQVQVLGGMDTNELAAWLDQKNVDAKTEAILRQVIEAQRQAAQLDLTLARLKEERNRIHQEQGRIRENLQSLGDRSSEKELRERFVRTLGTQEDRIEQIDRETAERIAKRDAARQRVNELLASLEYEG
jgi:hypothetical protein